MELSFLLQDHRIPVPLHSSLSYHVRVMQNLFVPGPSLSFVAADIKNMAAALVLTCVSCSSFELHFGAS
jgi:hypothetical protein